MHVFPFHEDFHAQGSVMADEHLFNEFEFQPLVGLQDLLWCALDEPYDENWYQHQNGTC